MKITNMPLLASHFIRARWRLQHLSSQQLTHYQDRRAHKIVEYTYAHSPFYQNHWHGYDLHNWQALPIVDKQYMMDHFDTFNTRNIPHDTAMKTALQAEQSRNFRPQIDGMTVGLSSGTSGHRGLFLISPQEQAAWAGTILARVLHQIPLKQLRVAFFLRSNSNLYEEVGQGLIQFRYFDLMQPIAEVVTILNTFQPHILIGPPSLLNFLSEEQQQNSLHIHPERLISVAEVLEPEDEKKLQKIFAAPVHQIYQCTEGFLATSCHRGSLHIQEDLVALQFETLPDSQPELQQEPHFERVIPIITDLWRKTQPIIRYRLNDVLQLEPDPCLCGSPFRVIHCIEGRCDDICDFESLDGELRHFYPDTIRRMILLSSPAILDYHVTQHCYGQIYIHLKIDPVEEFDIVARSVRASVQATLAQYHCQPAVVGIEEGLPPQTPGTKRRRVQRIKE